MQPKSRQQMLDQLANQQAMDVVIIGGGINGIGLFRELAQQKLKVLLVDKGDFCSGASAAPSRMIHGGLRYLENAEYALVKESLRERDLLLQNAPHYVKPLATTIPVFSWFDGLFTSALRFAGLTERSCNRGALVIKLGLHVYDLFCAKHSKMPPHQFNFGTATRQRWQALNPQLRCSASYYDAWISHPERLAMEMLLDSQTQYPDTLAINYLSLEGSDQHQLQLKDHVDNQILTVRTKALVNASGAWIDFTNSKLQRPSQLIGGTKGSHLILDNPQLLAALNGHMMYFENQEGRVCIVFPYFDKVLVGSTDIKITDPNDIFCTANERDYIFDSLRHIFPNTAFDSNDICFSFSGVRPLPSSDAQSNGQISRNHSIHYQSATGEQGFAIYSMIGGKWTTFRAFAEQMCERLAKDLNFPIKSNSRQQAIGGGTNFPATDIERRHWMSQFSANFQISQTRANQLLDRYGTRAQLYAAFLSENSQFRDTDNNEKLLQYNNEFSCGEIHYLIQHEQVESLLDLVLRRTNLAISGQLHLALLNELNQLLAEQKRWSSKRSKQELASSLAHLDKFHGLSQALLANRSQQRTADKTNQYPTKSIANA